MVNGDDYLKLDKNKVEKIFNQSPYPFPDVMLLHFMSYNYIFSFCFIPFVEKLKLVMHNSSPFFLLSRNSNFIMHV
jgi:hypothetical protein